jgi:Fur family transcriptional regulator, zinc uptake regulator
MVWPMATTAYEEKLCQQLAASGARLTRTRKLVAQVLATAQQPLSAYDIRDAILAQGRTIDVVSVYRILEVLENLRLVSRVPSTNQVFRSDSDTEPHDTCDHHPVFICNHCGTAQEIPWHGGHQLMRDIAEAGHVTASSLKLEIRGQCDQCE